MKIIRILTSMLLAIFAGAIFSVVTGADPSWSMASFVGVNVTVNAVAAATGWSIPGLAVDYTSLLWTHGTDNTPGVQTVGHFALKSWITNFPEAKSGGDLSVFNDYAKLESTVGFTFTSGLGWLKVMGSHEKGKVDFESQGEMDCKTYKNIFSFLFPGTNAEAKAWCRNMNNEDAVFLATEMDGTKVLVGHKYMRTHFSVSGTSGDAPTSQKGITITVECSHELPGPIYEGTVVEHDSYSS